MSPTTAGLRCAWSACTAQASPGAAPEPPTPAAAFEGYGKVVVAVDDLAYEGVLDVTGREGAARAARLRGEA